MLKKLTYAIITAVVAFGIYVFDKNVSTSLYLKNALTDIVPSSLSTGGAVGIIIALSVIIALAIFCIVFLAIKMAKLGKATPKKEEPKEEPVQEESPVQEVKEENVEDAVEEVAADNDEQEAKDKAEQEAREKTEQEAKDKAEQEAKDKAEQEAKDKAEQEAREKAEQEAKDKAEQEAKDKAEQEAKDKAEQEAREKAEQEAKDKAEQEAREKAEQEAKDKAEQEAREKAEQEAREKAEQEAKDKAEQEAREKAEQEAKDKAEQEAREKAEQEAKDKAEQEAREKAEQEAREQERLEEERLAKIAAEKKAAQEKQAIMQEEEAIKAEKDRADLWQKELAMENARILSDHEQKSEDNLSFKLSREDILDRMDEMSLNTFDYPVLANINKRASDSNPDSLKAGNYTFAVMYESKAGIIKFMARMDKKYAESLKINHPSIVESKYSSGDNWYKVIIDTTYKTKNEVFIMLDNWYTFVLNYYSYDGKAKKYVTDEEKCAEVENNVVVNVVKEVAEKDEALKAAEKQREDLNLFLLSNRWFDVAKNQIGEHERNKYKEEIDVTERENVTSTGLPLADTYYTKNGISDKGEKKSVCYAYVYQLKNDSIKLIMKLPKIYAERQSLIHTNLCRSKFPSGKNWYVTIVDSSYKSVNEIYSMLSRAKDFVESTETRE